FGAVGNGRITLSEVIRDGNNNFVDSMLVYHRADPLLQQLQDFSTFDPLQTIWVTKDLLLQGGTLSNPGVAQISRFTQTFRQVPEPASLMLLGLGATLVATRRRRRA